MIENPIEVIDEYIEHRLAREKQVLDALRTAETATIPELVEAIYTDVPTEMHGWAALSVWAHLRKLADDGAAEGDTLDGVWSAAA